MQRSLYLLPSFPHYRYLTKLVEYHNKDTDIDKAEGFHYQNSSRCLFIGMITPALPLSRTNLFSIAIILSFQDCHVNGIIHRLTFWIGFFSVSIIKACYLLAKMSLVTVVSEWFGLCS